MFPEVDWARPWLASVRDAARAVDAVGAAGMREAFDACAKQMDLRNAGGLPLRFVPQAELPEGTAYEQYIGTQGRVPTRDNLHDYFNALVWLSFPAIKRQLNALQAAQIAQAGIGKARGPARDAATLFDENAAILTVRASDEGRRLAEALRGHRWQEAFVALRGHFGAHAEPWLFGHALMEKLVAPYKAITAHTWVVEAGDGYFGLDAPGRRAWIDRRVAAQLAGGGLYRGCYTPLPVLGVPDWWPGQDPDFYADAAVFRPRRVVE